MPTPDEIHKAREQRARGRVLLPEILPGVLPNVAESI
jgi:hypothetical protein